MVSLKRRKEHTEKLSTFISSLLNKITFDDSKMSGFLLFLIHWIIIGVPTMYILFGEVNVMFFVSCIIYVIVFLLHLYFGGCILTRIERKLWDTKTWYGPWTFLFLILESIGVEMSDKRMNYVYNINATMITLVALARMLWYQ